MKLTLPTFSPLQQLTAGCSDCIYEQHADRFCSHVAVFKLIMGFAVEVQQLVFTSACVELVPQQLKPTDVFAEASESSHLVASRGTASVQLFTFALTAK
ncbi:TPA: hypothetical protein MGM24_004635 [Salmonella enterica]|nr:hypothetical protein [Salmonella enterica]